VNGQGSRRQRLRLLLFWAQEAGGSGRGAREPEATASQPTLPPSLLPRGPRPLHATLDLRRTRLLSSNITAPHFTSLHSRSITRRADHRQICDDSQSSLRPASVRVVASSQESQDVSNIRPRGIARPSNTGASQSITLVTDVSILSTQCDNSDGDQRRNAWAVSIARSRRH